MESKIYIRTLEVSGIIPAFMAMRLPRQSGGQSDSLFLFGQPTVDVVDDTPQIEIPPTTIVIGQKDMKLAKTLIRSGDEHAKVMRGIVAYAEFSLPRYIWQELDTYTVGMIPLCSESSMHGKDSKNLSGEELVAYKENLHEGFVQKRIRGFSYQALRHMHFQRENHRLPVWRNVICPWIESLPLANDLILTNPWWKDRIEELEEQLRARDPKE